ncbi:DUF952 domain-containing protein [Notoacmeibacter ruber]|uniref:DUF952 domain-containing protein n=2 Tax=Notoacmeibacter ruber TaxID=2670375 RepID=A0A3L7JEX0_9HYPH|nr:DUF952 domain-containing protein [Notoacmeibacter ruber]RLQ89338.1 DUF952 domain-containing protein [Notoacmeibacter ruber]
MARMIYKAVPAPMWQEAKSRDQWTGAPVDLADGFIHFSTAEQLPETLAKHFAGQQDLLLVAIKADDLGGDLRWEVSRGGALFPHLHAALRCDKVAWVEALSMGPDGQHHLPERCT